MKKTPALKSRKAQEMAKKYRFDYSKAKPNRFATRMKDVPLVAVIDRDVAKIFATAEDVNKALRALISAMPKAKGLKNNLHCGLDSRPICESN